MSEQARNRDEVGTVRREDHDLPDGEAGGYTLWVQMVATPTRRNPESHWYLQAIWSTSPGNIGTRSDDYGDEGGGWKVGDWPIIARIPGTPAAATASA